MGNRKKQPGGRRRFSDEFKANAVALVLGPPRRQIAEVARELGIYDSSLGNWVRQAEIDAGERDGLTSTEREELARVRKENARLEMENDLLKRTVAFWVKESTG